MNSDKIYIKAQPYNKVSSLKVLKEYELQKYLASKYDFIPKVHSLTFLPSHSELKMDLVLKGLTLAENFSDDPEDIPIYIWNEMRQIVEKLYYDEGIEYIDITPYNFMIDPNDKIWLIDFGHAYYTDKTKSINWFLNEFIFDGSNQFNPDFK